MRLQPRQPAIAPGIYPDAYGFEARVKVKGTTRSKRFPLATPLDVLQLWQADERAYLLRCAADDAPEPRDTRGAFPGDVAHYLETRAGRPGYKSDRSHLAAWSTALGQRPRYQVTKHVCEAQMATWLAAGAAVKTLTHRKRVLRELWHALDGAQARTPLDDYTLPRAVKRLPAPVDDAVILAVGESLRQGLVRQQVCGPGPTRTIATVHHGATKCAQAYARFLIYALTGQRPSQIGDAQPAHVDRVHGIWWVTAMKGGNPIPFPLSDELDRAFVLFDRAGCWGHRFNTSSFAKTLRRHGWPAGYEPYAMRHAFAVAQLLHGTDLGDLQGLMGHTTPTTTRIYAPVLVSRLKTAIARRPMRLLAAK